MFYQQRTQHHPTISIPKQEQEPSPHSTSFLPVFVNEVRGREQDDIRDAEELNFESDYASDIFSYLLDFEVTFLIFFVTFPFYLITLFLIPYSCITHLHFSYFKKKFYETLTHFLVHFIEHFSSVTLLHGKGSETY